MHTMDGPSMGIGLLHALGAIHFLAALALLIGAALLLGWCYKQLTPAQLKKWGIILVVGGGIVSLITLGAVKSMHYGHSGKMMMKHGENGAMMMKKMGSMKSDDAMDMSMKGMSMMLEGKTGDSFDQAFLEMMIPHHEGAIDMAKLAQKNAGHAEIKKMANDIISAQQKEIDQMNAWLTAWGMTK